MPRPYGELFVSQGSQVLAISATPTQVNVFSLTGGGASNKIAQDIQPDQTNNRLKVLPGVYIVDAYVEFTSTAECDVSIAVRKNAVAATGLTDTVPCQQNIVTFTPSLSPVLVAANTTAEQSLAVAGILTTDKLLSVIKPTAQAGLGLVGWRIPSNGNIALNYVNDTAGGLTPTAAETYTVIVGRFGKNTIRLFGLLNVLTSDSPGNIPVFPDPTGGKFTGQGGSPLTMVPIDITLASSTGTPNLTITNARLALASLAT